jgi:hypothetical protein
VVTKCPPWGLFRALFLAAMYELGKIGSHDSVIIQNWGKNHFVEPRVYVHGWLILLNVLLSCFGVVSSVYIYLTLRSASMDPTASDEYKKKLIEQPTCSTRHSR